MSEDWAIHWSSAVASRWRDWRPRPASSIMDRRERFGFSGAVHRVILIVELDQDDHSHDRGLVHAGAVGVLTEDVVDLSLT